MSDIETEHYNDEHGDQRTVRTVTVTDAKNDEYQHAFETAGDPTEFEGYEYTGDGEPPESAVDKLREYLSDE